MAQTTTSNTLFNIQNALAARSNNIANAKAVGGFAVDPQFISQASTGIGGGSVLVQRNDFVTKGQFVQTGVESDLSIGGAGTTGLFAVQLTNGDIAYTANGSMRLGANKQLLLADGSVVMGWQLTNGNLPTNTSTTSSLTPLSLLGVQSKATPTTQIGLVMNLDQSQATLQGAGGSMNLALNSVITATPTITSIIIPASTTQGILHLGDEFTLQTSAQQTPTIFQYGGIAVTSGINNATPLFGTVTTPSQPLPTVLAGVAPQATQLANNYSITITVGGGSPFTFNLGNQGPSAGYFTSISDLAAAINFTGQLRASIDNSSGRLYISSINANQSLSFTESNVGTGGSLINALNIDNVPSMNPMSTLFSGGAQVLRFATVAELEQKINGVTGLKSTIQGLGLNFNASNPLQTLTVGGRNLEARSIYKVTAGYTPTTNYGTWPLNNTVTINAPAHFLNAGDFVRLTNGPANLGNGIYEVLSTNADSFVVGTSGNVGAANIGATVACATDGSFIWQKVDGGKSQQAVTAGGANINCATNVNNTAIFTNLSVPRSLQLVLGDVVYVQNSNSIQNGYYRVTATAGGPPLNSITLGIIGNGATAALSAGNAQAPWIGGGAFFAGGACAAATAVPSVVAATAAAATLVAAPTVANANTLISAIQTVIAQASAAPGAVFVAMGGNGALAPANAALVLAQAVLGSIPNAVGAQNDYSATAHAAAVEAGNLSITKVASTIQIGTAGAFDSFPLETFAPAAGVLGTAGIRVSTPTNHKAGDLISFRQLTIGSNTPLVIGGGAISITQDKYYQVTGIDTVNGIVYFNADLVGANTAANVTGGYIGFQNTAPLAAGFPGIPVADLAGVTSLGVTAYVDFISDPFNALGVELNQGQGQTPVTAKLLNSPLAATYNATDPTRNFASGAITQNVFSQTLSVIDNLGAQHSVILSFGKTNNNTWAVEMYLPENANGTYDANTSNPVVPGQLAAGTLQFNGQGQLTNVVGLSAPVTIAWNNGATPTPLSIDWGAVDGLSLITGLPATPGVTQINGNGTNNVQSITNNGIVPGNLNGMTFDETGILYATFDNGTTVAVAQIAIGTFTNFNGLTQKNGYLYETPDSGAVLLKTPGKGGVGQINTGGITSSAVNDTSEYLDVIDLSQASAMAVNVAAKVNQTRDQLVNNLAR